MGMGQNPARFLFMLDKSTYLMGVKSQLVGGAHRCVGVCSNEKQHCDCLFVFLGVSWVCGIDILVSPGMSLYSAGVPINSPW